MKKISELASTETINDEDMIAIVQGGTTKKVSKILTILKEKIGTKLINNLLTTEAGKGALDAAMGKYLMDKIDELNGKTLEGLSLNGISEYPTAVGVYRVTGNNGITGIPNNGSYGVLIIAGMGYYLHIFIDSNNKIYFSRTDGLVVPTKWSQPMPTTGGIFTGDVTFQSAIYGSCLPLYSLPGHTYGIDWDGDNVIIYVDGLKVLTLKRTE